MSEEIFSFVKAKQAKKPLYSNDELKKWWRLRESQLLRLLSAKNLESLKKAFDQNEEGLSPTEFIKTLMSLVGHVMLDREELCVQILELFTNIDINGDGTLEWDELLTYVVQTTAASIKIHNLEEKGAFSRLFSLPSSLFFVPPRLLFLTPILSSSTISLCRHPRCG